MIPVACAGTDSHVPRLFLWGLAMKRRLTPVASNSRPFNAFTRSYASMLLAFLIAAIRANQPAIQFTASVSQRPYFFSQAPQSSKTHFSFLCRRVEKILMSLVTSILVDARVFRPPTSFRLVPPPFSVSIYQGYTTVLMGSHDFT